MTTDLVQSSRQVLAQHGRTFHLASMLLPRHARGDAAILYAFCRLVDDLADEAPDLAQAHQNLTEVLQELRFQRPARPLVEALHSMGHRRGFDLQAAEHLVEAVMGDLDEVQIPDDRSLLRYCYGVAGTVGLMMSGVLGVTEKRAIAHAIDLGVAMQITNICRDIKEDAHRGRVYLPRTRLAAHGLSPEELLGGDVDRHALSQATQELLDLADQYYRSGDAGLRDIPFRGRLAIAVASAVYRHIGRRLRRTHRGDPWHGRTIVPTPTRLWVAIGAVLRVMDPRSWINEPSHDARLHTPLRGLPGAQGG